MIERPQGAIAWSNEPHIDRSPKFEIWSPKPGKEITSVILSQEVLGVEVHHVDGRTRPHLQPREICEGCLRLISKRWKGYLCGWDNKQGRGVILEITHEAYLKCPDLKELRGRLRGRGIRLARAGESKNSRVVAKLIPVSGSTEMLPEPFDLRAALERIWYTVKGSSEVWQTGERVTNG